MIRLQLIGFVLRFVIGLKIQFRGARMVKNGGGVPVEMASLPRGGLGHCTYSGAAS